MSNSPVSGSQNLPVTTPATNDNVIEENAAAGNETNGSINAHGVKSSDANKSLLLKDQQNDQLSPSQKTKSLTARNVGNTGSVHSDTAQSRIPPAPPAPPLPGTVPTPPPPPPVGGAARDSITSAGTVLPGVNPTPEPKRTLLTTNKEVKNHTTDTQEPESVPEDASTEAVKKASRQRTGIKKALAHIFAVIRRFVQGTNFEKFSPETLRELESAAGLIDNTNTSEKAIPILSKIHRDLTEWNDDIDKLVKLKNEEGADSPKRQELLEEMKKRKKKVGGIATTAETILEIKNDLNRQMRELEVKHQNVAIPNQEELIREANKTVASQTSEPLKPSSLADAVRNAKLKKTGVNPEQASSGQTEESWRVTPLTMNDEIKAFQFKNKGVTAEKKPVSYDEEPEFMKRRREIQNRNSENKE